MLLEIRTVTGRARRCDAGCHDAAPGGHCECVCGGRFHGIGSRSAVGVPGWERDEARRAVRLEPGTYVQLRVE